jgi:hypothetical protein
MSELNGYIRHLSKIVPEDLCRDIIAAVDGFTPEQIKSEVDSFQVIALMGEKPKISSELINLLLMVFQQISESYIEKCVNPGKIWPDNGTALNFEAPVVEIYNPNDIHDYHVDSDSVDNCRREFAVTLFLNNAKSARLAFDLGDARPNIIKPEIGDVVVHPCNFLYPHKLSTKTNKLYTLQSYNLV